MPEIPLVDWLKKRLQKKQPAETLLPVPESPKPPMRRANLHEIGKTRPTFEQTFPHYQKFANAETLGLFLRAEPPEGPILVSLANATYDKGVNTDPSQWVFGTYIGNDQPGTIIEVDPEILHAAEASGAAAHTGFTQWAAKLEQVTPIMVAARSDEMLPYLENRADAVVVVSPSPEFMDGIVTDGYRMLKPGGELTVVLDPITAEAQEGSHELKPDLVPKLLALTPGAVDVTANGSPLITGEQPQTLRVKEYMDKRLPRTRYIDQCDDPEAPVLVFQVKRP